MQLNHWEFLSNYKSPVSKDNNINSLNCDSEIFRFYWLRFLKKCVGYGLVYRELYFRWSEQLITSFAVIVHSGTDSLETGFLLSFDQDNHVRRFLALILTVGLDP